MVSKDGPLTYLLVYHPSGQLMHNVHVAHIMLEKELSDLPTSHLLHIDVPPVQTNSKISHGCQYQPKVD